MEVVGEEEDRDALLGDRAEFVDEAGADHGVLAGAGFVGDEERGAADQLVGEDDPLLLPAGQLVRIPAEQLLAIGKLSLLQRVQDPLPDL